MTPAGKSIATIAALLGAAILVGYFSVYHPTAGIVVLAVGAIACLARWAWRRLRDLRDSRDAPHWPTTEATILESRVITHTDSEGPNSYLPHVRFSYRLDDRDFESSRLRFALSDFPTISEAEAVVARYPIGGRVRVSHHPTRFERVVIEATGVQPGDVRNVVFSFFLVAAAIAALALWLSSRSTSTPPARPAAVPAAAGR